MSRMLFDYRCTACTWEGEVYAETPAPLSQQCPACGDEARRRYTTAGLARSGRSLAAIAPAGGSIDCRDNADVPGLCHVAPSARRGLIAYHRGDVETYQAEKKRQTREFEQNGPPPAANVFAHGH
ncbi:hypothetical protein [Georgenia sp. AZ-5]|uniref:hypothetical protein n=1 Tax=Georgenia sp. AZ-5 TaxID=3367526 RepID=UPI0037543696